MTFKELLHKPIVLKVDYSAKCLIMSIFHTLGMLLIVAGADRYDLHKDWRYEAVYRMSLIVGLVIPSAMVAWFARGNQQLWTWLKIVAVHCGVVGLLFAMGIELKLPHELARYSVAWYFMLGTFAVTLPAALLLMTGNSKIKSAYPIRGAKRRFGEAKPQQIPFSSDGLGVRDR